MSLEDALTALVPKPKPQGCKSCAWLADQTQAVRDYVQDWLLEQHSTKQLHEVLKQHGYPQEPSRSVCGRQGQADGLQQVRQRYGADTAPVCGERVDVFDAALHSLPSPLPHQH